MSSVNSQLIALFESNEYLGHRRVIISSAGTFKRNNLKQYLRPNDVIYAEVLPNPSLNQLIDFFRIIKPTQKDLVFGIGGGSVIDFAKLVALFAETPTAEIKSNIESAQFGSIQKVLRLVIVPTLFGSGAEQTPFAVCYIGKKKYSVANRLLLPARVAYIPEINISAPSTTKLANVLDCFCQAAESLTAQSANDVSAEYAEKTLRHLAPIAKKYIRGNSIDLAAKMAEASNLCGKAIAISKTTGPHAMSYFLTSTLRWNHGTAVAMAFLFFLKNYRESNIKCPSVENLLKILIEVLPFETCEEYFMNLGLETKVLAKQLNFNIDPHEWISSVNIERLSNGPNIDMSWLNVENINNYFHDIRQMSFKNDHL